MRVLPALGACGGVLAGAIELGAAVADIVSLFVG
jgi:hypothetical protein